MLQFSILILVKPFSHLPISPRGCGCIFLCHWWFCTISLYKLHIFPFQFDRFRRKVIEYTFSGGFPQTLNRELDDDELLDHLRHLAQEKLSLVEHIKHYEDLQNEVRSSLRYDVYVHGAIFSFEIVPVPQLSLT